MGPVNGSNDTGLVNGHHSTAIIYEVLVAGELLVRDGRLMEELDQQVWEHKDDDYL